MSDEALTWCKTVETPDATAWSILRELCGYADPLGKTWSAVPTLAFDIRKSERQVQRGLRALEASGLVRKTGKFHHRGVPIYQLAIDTPGPRGAERARIIAGIRAEASGRRRRPDPEPDLPGFTGDVDVTSETAGGDAHVTARGDADVTQQQGTTTSETDVSSERARAGDETCLAAFEAYPVEGRKGVSSFKKWAEAWASEVAGGADPARLLRSVTEYAADRKAWGSSGRPRSAHGWLADGCWDGFGLAPAPAAGRPGDGRWPGPADVRAQLVASHGEDWVRSWLDPCGWDGAAVVARLRFTAGKLREALAGTGITVLEPDMVGQG